QLPGGNGDGHLHVRHQRRRHGRLPVRARRSGKSRDGGSRFDARRHGRRDRHRPRQADRSRLARAAAGRKKAAGPPAAGGAGPAGSRGGTRRSLDMNLRVENRGAVRILTIDGEKQMNVLSPPLVGELAEQARQATVDSSVRAVVLTGAGTRAFCAGANLKERQGWSEDEIRRWLVALHANFREIERCTKPWIAAINGLALGGGCELALC